MSLSLSLHNIVTRPAVCLIPHTLYRTVSRHDSLIYNPFRKIVMVLPTNIVSPIRSSVQANPLLIILLIHVLHQCSPRSNSISKLNSSPSLLRIVNISLPTWMREIERISLGYIQKRFLIFTELQIIIFWSKL